MREHNPKNFDYLFIVFLFIIWRVLLFIPLIVSQQLPLQQHHLGGGMQNYLAHPEIWSWANFDGEHYLAIAQFGYRPLTHFFFPLYPFLIKNLQLQFITPLYAQVITALIVSNLSFLLALFGLAALMAIDYKRKTVFLTLLLISFFPTAFYFSSVYTEGVFLALVIWSFYFARKRNWPMACLLAALSTSARVVGIVMLPALLAEYYLQSRNDKQKSIVTILLILCIPIGLIYYMLFLQQTTGDHLAFFHSIEIYGSQRSTNLILLPQVFYRYIFKILPVLNYSYFPQIFSTWMEMLAGVGFLVLSLLAFTKTRISYAIFGLGAFLIPTLSGSFSSLPRYILVVFPAFIVLSLFMQKLPRVVAISIFMLSFLGLLYAESLFIRGYWVA